MPKGCPECYGNAEKMEEYREKHPKRSKAGKKGSKRPKVNPFKAAKRGN